MNCQHPECDCGNASVARNGKQYCSESCAAGASLGESTCGCGHQGCSASPDTRRFSASPVGAEWGSQDSKGYGLTTKGSGASGGNPRASASSSSGPQAPRRPESGAASQSPLPPSPEDRGRRKDIGSGSSHPDSSRRPDAPAGKPREQSGGPHLSSDDPTKPPRR